VASRLDNRLILCQKNSAPRLVPAREETMLMLENQIAYRVIVSAICA
jgi:hypothetical protein